MFWFSLFSCFYPLNLYIFEFLFPSPDDSAKLKVKATSILVSCSILWIFLGEQIDFGFNWLIPKWTAVALLPFLLPLKFADSQEFGSFLFLRNFVIAPACEELYFRILLPKMCPSKMATSLAFSVAHAHPLLFKRNWTSFRVQEVLAQCGISFCFGFICSCIKSKMIEQQNNFWLWTALTIIHGVANYCGLPFIIESKLLGRLQVVILVISTVLIIK